MDTRDWPIVECSRCDNDLSFFEDYFKFADLDTIISLLAEKISNSPSSRLELLDALRYYSLLERK